MSVTQEQMYDGVRRLYLMWGWPEQKLEQVDFTAHCEYVTIAEAAQVLVTENEVLINRNDLIWLLFSADPQTEADNQVWERIHALLVETDPIKKPVVVEVEAGT